MKRVALLAIATIGTVVTAAEPQKIVFARVFPQPGQIGLFIASADGAGERPLLTPTDSEISPNIMRTIDDVEDPILREVKTIHEREGRSMGTVVSDLLADALSATNPLPRFVLEALFR